MNPTDDLPEERFVRQGKAIAEVGADIAAQKIEDHKKAEKDFED